MREFCRRSFCAALLALPLLWAPAARGGEQQYERLSDSTRAALHGRLGESDLPPPRWYFGPPEEGEEWLIEMSSRLRRILPKWSPYYQDAGLRRDLLKVGALRGDAGGGGPAAGFGHHTRGERVSQIRDFHRGRARADAGDAVLDGFNRGQKPQLV